MWIPHTIPKSTLCLFAPPKTGEVIGFHGPVESDDFRWASRMPKPLKLLCLNVVGDHFSRYPPDLFGRIAPIHAVYLVETLRTDLPIATVVHVPDGEYWRRRAADVWPNRAAGSRPSDGDKRSTAALSSSPKTFFMNAYVSETVENLEPGYVVETELAALLNCCGPLVTELDCGQLRVRGRQLATDLCERPRRTSDLNPKHVDLEFVLRRLDNVASVRLVYGVKKIEVDERREIDPYRFHIDDMDALGRGLVFAERLAELAVTRSDLDAAKLKRLLPYLEECCGLRAVDFSHCKLTSAGARYVARYAKTAERLKSVNLCDNRIGADGAKSLAYAMLRRRRNGACQPIELNLNMNDINDLGAKYLASALASGVQAFTKLRIRNCNVTEIGAMHIAKSLSYDRGLRTLEMDNNALNMEVAVELHATMKTNFNIAELSVLNCNFPEKITDFLRNVAFHNRHGKRSEFNYVDVEHLYDRANHDSVFEDGLSIESEFVEE